MMTEEEVYQYIEVNPVNGRTSVFWGTSITPELVLDDFAKGMSVDEILKQHPKLTANHLEAAGLYARIFPTDNQMLAIIALRLLSGF